MNEEKVNSYTMRVEFLFTVHATSQASARFQAWKLIEQMPDSEVTEHTSELSIAWWE
jgi:hypothetical protein